MSKRVIIIASLGVVVCAAVFFLLREGDPQTILRQATKKLLAEKTFHVESRGTIVGLPKTLGGDVVSSATGVDIDIVSDIDRTDPTRQASVSTFDFRQGLSTGGQTTLAGDARRKDGMHYARLRTLEGVSGIDASRVVNVWMKSGRSFFDLLRGSVGTEPPLTAAGLETMKTSLQGVDLFAVASVLPKETLGGVKTFHYAVRLNMETVSALLLKAREVRTGKHIGSEDILDVTNELIQWGTPVGEVWVDAKTRRFKKITLGTALGRDGKGGAAAGTLLFSNEGKPVKVDVPDAQDVDTVLGPLFDKRLNLAGGRALAQATPTETKQTLLTAPGSAAQTADTDSDGLVDAQEFFYGADAWNPDTDGDGYADGLEVEKGMNPSGPGTLFSFGL